MWLEHGYGPQSAKWDEENQRWNVGKKKIYRWCTNDQLPVSDWLKSLTEAIDWIIDYDNDRLNDHGV